MSDTTRGDPELLDAYTADALPQVEAVHGLAAEYAAAVSAFNAAGPNDLGTTTPDRSPQIDAALEALSHLDRIPAAFADALRNLDAFAATLGLGPDQLGHAGTRDARLLALTAARLADPQAPPAALLPAAEDELRRGILWPWRNGVLAWLGQKLRTPMWWTETGVGIGTTAVEAAGKPVQQRGLVVPVRGHWNRGNWIDPHHRWRPGYASVMNRATSADRVARWGPRAGRTGAAAGLVLAGAGQAVEDWDDPTLTSGDRIARVGMTTLTEGVGGATGAYVGAILGQTFIPIPVVGAVIGGLVGGWIGGATGETVNENLAAVTQAGGDMVDEALNIGGDLLDDIGGSFS